MKFSKCKKIIAISLALCMFLSGGAVIYALFDNNPSEGNFISDILKPIHNLLDGISGGNSKDQLEKQQAEERENEITKKAESIEVVTDVEAKIKASKGVKGEANILKYKKLCAEFDIPEKYKEIIDSSIMNNDDLNDVCVAYEFLYRYFGTVDDLKSVLTKIKNRSKIEDILEEYIAKDDLYEPKRFALGELDKLFGNAGITADDITFSDILSQKGLRSFDELIDMRIQGKEWSEISLELGVLNTSGQIERVAVTGDEVEECVTATGLDEDKALKKIIRAKKAKVDDDKVVKHIKNKEKDGKSLTEFYDKKYR